MTQMLIDPDFNHLNDIYSPNNAFYFLVLPVLILLLVYWKVSRRNLIKLGEQIPGPKGYPIIGSALEFVGTSPEIFKRIYAKTYEYGKTIRLWAGPRLLIFITDPRDVEIILSSHDHIDKSNEYKFFKPWLGEGLLISTGSKWKSHRKLIAPTFNLNVLKSFIDLFNANSRETVKKMQQEINKDFDCHDYMSEATVEILLETVMGVSKKTQDQSGYDYAMAVMRMCDILHLRHTKIWLRSDFIFTRTKHAKTQEKLLNTIHSLTKKVIKEKRAAYEKGIKGSTAEVPDEIKTQKCEKNENYNINNGQTVVEGLSYGQSAGLKDDIDVDDDVGEKKRMAFLDLLVEASQDGSIINDEEIKEQVDTIMFEGHDTTAAASSFFLSLMGIHKDIQERVVQELDDIFGDTDRPVTFADTLEMKYLERCLMETLRMFPPVPVIARELKYNVKLVSENYTLPAGATIIIGTYRVHRDPNTYPNPDNFDPDNFLPERSVNRHYYSFIPFSAGPRSCVGRKYAMLKLKILLSTILRHYRIHSDLKEEDFQLQADIILKRAEGFKVRIEPRKCNLKV
nr:cytochrome P450 [Agasicles hygrophila]